MGTDGAIAIKRTRARPVAQQETPRSRDVAGIRRQILPFDA